MEERNKRPHRRSPQSRLADLDARIFGPSGDGGSVGTSGSKRRRRFQFAAILSLVALLGIFVAQPALAVHDMAFQLDGDVIASTTTNVGGSTQNFDWDSIFNSSGTKFDPLPTGFTAAAFRQDFKTKANGSFDASDDSTYATGSKDILHINQWQCAHSNNVGGKVDIMNAYATAFTAPNGDQILYFAQERNANDGDANVGFWFLQDPTVNCSSPGGATTFSGAHQDGDLFIVSSFTKGGNVSTIDVYRWNGNDVTGSLGTTSVAHGVDCKSTAGGDTACATVNGTTNGVGGTITTPWLTANKDDGAGHSLRTAEFFEGGLNLTQSNLGDRCFNTFVSNTRSSQQLSATIFDFAGASIGECTSKTTTTPSITSSAIPAHGSLGVTDSAKIEVTGVNLFSGTVKFFLCRSSELDAQGECETGGTQIGATSTLTNVTSPKTVVSDTAGITAADHYCWRAEYSGDAARGVPKSSDFATSECFDVTPLQPALTTDATDGPVDFGSKISDTISLTGTADRPGTNGIGPGGTINATNRAAADGSISVTAFGPDNCTTHALDTTITVNGDNAAYGGPGSVTEFTPGSPGTYTYVASYSGDSPNTLGVPATACPDPTGTEAVTVRQIPTEIKTKQSWFPNDTATITATSGNLTAGGTVVFSLYNNATCTGAAKYSETKTLTGGNPTEEVGTNNTNFNITTLYTDAGTVVAFSWKVVYTPAVGDTAHTGKQSACDAEHFSITYTNDPGPGANLP